MSFQLNKKNIIIFAISIAILFSMMVFDFGNGWPMFDYFGYDDYSVIVVWLFSISLICVNLFMFMDRADFAKLAAVVNLGSVVILCFYEWFRGYGDFENVCFGGYLIAVLSAVVLYLVVRKNQK